MNYQPSPDTMAGEPPVYAEMIADLLIAMFGSTGLRLSVLDWDGMPVGRMGNKNELCDYVMNCPDTHELCTLCTQRGLEVVRRTGEAYTYRCHMGLVSTIIPVLAQEKTVAFLVFSGYHMEPEHMENLPTPVTERDRTRQFMAPAANPDDSPYFSRERMEEIARLLSVSASFLVEVSGRTRMLLDVQNQGLELLAQANHPRTAGKEGYPEPNSRSDGSYPGRVPVRCYGSHCYDRSAGRGTSVGPAHRRAGPAHP